MNKKLSDPMRLIVGLAALGLGIALIMTPLSPHGVAIATGTGIVLSGLALIIRPDTAGTRRVFPLIIGVTCILLGATMALWPDAGAPWLAFLAAAALLVFGLHTGFESLRGRSDHRAASLLTALAAILIGVVSFAWPVLTLSIFRLGFGAWLLFLGAQWILSVAFARRHAKDASSSTHSPRHGWIRTVAASLSLVLAVGVSLGSAWILGGTPLPEPDAFYTPPKNVPAEAGKLIRADALTDGVPGGTNAFRILYTTTHSDGTPAVSSGTVLLPVDRGADPLPIITVSHGTTGVAPKCAPSLSATPFADGAGTALEMMVQDHGWAAVTSDYIGLGTQGPHPYLLGDAEARNVLDASLAARELDNISLSTRTVVWGHSQGGQGALWTGQIAAEYAPELTVEGIAAFAPAADLYGLADADKKEAAGKTVSAYIAATWNDIFPEFELEQHLTPGSATGVEKISDLCFNGKDVLSAIIRGTQVTNQVFPDSLLDGKFGDKLKEQTPVGPFPAPVLVAQGLADPLVKPKLQQDWVTNRCAAGEAIDYRTFKGLDHTSLVAADSPLTPELVTWTLARWNGEAPTPTC
ncbi:MAG: lipase family protein [Leucobacter sp.]